MEQILEKKKLQFSFLEKRRREKKRRNEKDSNSHSIQFNLCRYCCRK